MTRLDQAFISAYSRNGNGKRAGQTAVAVEDRSVASGRRSSKSRARSDSAHEQHSSGSRNSSALAAAECTTTVAVPVAPADPFQPQRQIDCFHWPEAASRMGSLVAAGFQDLANLIQLRYRENKLKLLLLTSCYRKEGRTTVAIGLARSLARMGDPRVVLVDGDFGNPQLAEQLGLEPSVGFEDVLAGRSTLGAALVESRWDHVAVLPLRHRIERADDLGDLSRLNQVLASLREHYGLIMVDGAPLFSSPNPLTTHPQVDAALLVVNRTVTPEHSLEQAQRQLEQAEVSLLGVVENFV